MASQMYTHLSTRQPCAPSCSRSEPRGTWPLTQQRHCSFAHSRRQQPAASVTCRASLVHHQGRPGEGGQHDHHQEDGRDRQQRRHHQQRSPFGSSGPRHHQHHDQQQPVAVYSPPAWHPRLFGVHDSKRAALQAAAEQLYGEVWNAGCVDLLDELADAGVCFNDALGMEEDAFSRASLKGLVREFQASHPLLRYDLEDVIVDEARDTVVVHYTVTAAHLLPQPGAAAAGATGHVSVVSGMDKLHFNTQGLISSILSFRQRFNEEEVELIDWNSV